MGQISLSDLGKKGGTASAKKRWGDSQRAKATTPSGKPKIVWKRPSKATGMTVEEFASLGGKAAAANMTPEERTARARKAAEKRWANHVPKPKAKKQG